MPMSSLIFTIILCLCPGQFLETFQAQPTSLSIQTQDRVTAPDNSNDLYEALDSTFTLLLDKALLAYRDQFDGDPVNLAAVSYFQALVALAGDQPEAATRGFLESYGYSPQSTWGLRSAVHLDKADEDSRRKLHWEWVRAGRIPFDPSLSEPDDPIDQAHLRWGATQLDMSIAGQHLDSDSYQPLVVLRRSDSTRTADCPVYDPLLFRFHTLAHSAKTALRHSHVERSAQIAETHNRLHSLKKTPQNKDLSQRRFISKYSEVVQELAWQYRSKGIVLSQQGRQQESHVALLRAEVLAESLFPVASRGRMSEMPPALLAQLGDIQARIGHYRQLLMYVYAPDGLPEFMPMTQPIATLAVIAEGVSLLDDSQDAHEEEFPETLAAILNDTTSASIQTVSETPGTSSPATLDVSNSKSQSNNKWWIGAILGLAGTAILVCGIVTRLKSTSTPIR